MRKTKRVVVPCVGCGSVDVLSIIGISAVYCRCSACGQVDETARRFAYAKGGCGVVVDTDEYTGLTRCGNPNGDLCGECRASEAR